MISPFCMTFLIVFQWPDSRFPSYRYKVGESFLHLSQSMALSRLELDQATVATQLAELRSIADECESGMKELKVRLYAKFGRAINLDE